MSAPSEGDPMGYLRARGAVGGSEPAENVIRRMRDGTPTDPADVLALLPAELLADIRMCAGICSLREHTAGDRVLDALARVAS